MQDHVGKWNPSYCYHTLSVFFSAEDSKGWRCQKAPSLRPSDEKEWVSTWNCSLIHLNLVLTPVCVILGLFFLLWAHLEVRRKGRASVIVVKLGEWYIVWDVFCHSMGGASSLLAEEVCEVCRSSAIQVRRIHCGKGEGILGQSKEMCLLFCGVVQGWFVHWRAEMSQGQNSQVWGCVKGTLRGVQRKPVSTTGRYEDEGCSIQKNPVQTQLGCLKKSLILENIGLAKC